MGAVHAGFACGGFGPLLPRRSSPIKSVVKNSVSPSQLSVRECRWPRPCNDQKPLNDI